MTVGEIIGRCGRQDGTRWVNGAPCIEQESGRSLTRDAVYKWRKIGIPEKHWDLITRLSGVAIGDIFKANKLAREAEHA